MPKKQAATSLEESIMERIKRIAIVDRRSIAEVVAWAVEKGLPEVEEELRSKLTEGGALSPQQPVLEPAITTKSKRKIA
jgi:hypothetical protein